MTRRDGNPPLPGSGCSDAHLFRWGLDRQIVLDPFGIAIDEAIGVRAKQDSKAHQLLHHIGDPVMLAGALGVLLLLGFAPLSALPLRDIAVLRLPLRGPPSATL
jgi:hypothetical protein